MHSRPTGVAVRVRDTSEVHFSLEVKPPLTCGTQKRVIEYERTCEHNFTRVRLCALNIIVNEQRPTVCGIVDKLCENLWIYTRMIVPIRYS